MWQWLDLSNRTYCTIMQLDLLTWAWPLASPDITCLFVTCLVVVIFCYCSFQVLLLIDASFGFEMEIFEFLNICQVHGFPKIMGVLTHLDLLKNNKALKKTKKRLKTRFWTEVYQVIIMFALVLYLRILPLVNLFLHYYSVYPIIASSAT